ncbi:MAG: virulence RhuM family protein, partial [Candidatus Bathyarchaeota archaeon]|nr:virulence RhuM family protein [Candidatus Termiticorpusculum sp.]
RWVIRWPPRCFINLGPLPAMSTQPLTDARVVVLRVFVGLLCSLDFGYFNVISVLFNIVNCGKKKVGNYGLMSMEDWISRLDAFLQFNEYDLLHNKGTVERKVADELAKEEFRKYRLMQDEKYMSDFDKSTHKYLMSDDE